MIRPLVVLALVALAGCGSKQETAETKADAVCACETLACAQVAQEALVAHVIQAGADETAEQVKTARTKATTCVAKLQADPAPDEAIAAAKAMADAICGCTDLTCAQAQHTTHGKRVEGFKKSVGKADDAKAIRAHGERAKACIAKLRGAGTAAPTSAP